MKINILTRCSRKYDEGFGRTLSSVKEQKNVDINWLISYEDQETLDYLNNQDLPPNTILIKVPKYNIIPNLNLTYEHHDVHTDYTNWDWDKWSVIPHMGDEIPNTKTLNFEEVKFEKNGFWVKWFGNSMKKTNYHFPVNIYLKILELYVKDGWIVYLDDGNIFETNSSLEKLEKEIIKHDDDTLHIFKLMNTGRAWTTPRPKFWKFYETGLPLVYGECSGSCICFNSKWKEYTMWDEWRFADYRVAKSLESTIPKRNLIDLVVIWCCDENYTLKLQRTKNPEYEFNS